jgi:hypothetical protein
LTQYLSLAITDQSTTIQSKVLEIITMKLLTPIIAIALLHTPVSAIPTGNAEFNVDRLAASPSKERWNWIKPRQEHIDPCMSYPDFKACEAGFNVDRQAASPVDDGKRWSWIR